MIWYIIQSTRYTQQTAAPDYYLGGNKEKHRPYSFFLVICENNDDPTVATNVPNAVNMVGPTFKPRNVIGLLLYCSIIINRVSSKANTLTCAAND